MPGKSPRKKDLYLGKNMADLNKLGECKDLGNNVTIIIKSADKTFREAVHQDELSDEERAFVLYMRYFNVIQIAKKKAEYIKQKEYFDNLIGKKNQLHAIERAEMLAKSLKERYDLIEAEAVAKKLEALDEKKREEKKDAEKGADEEKGDDKENGSPTVQPVTAPGSISPMELFTLLNDRETQLILMDVRSEEDYADSHISHKACVSVPARILEPGTTVNYISNALPEASRSLWKKRGQVDHVILLDWRSTSQQVTIGSTLRTLKDALFKYDATVILKSEPLVLEGGYEQWLLYYPTVTTNPHILCPARPEDFITSSALDFDYPDFDEPSNEKQPLNNQSGASIPPQAANATSQPGLPSVDRSLKPKPVTRSVNDTPLNNKTSESKITNNLKNTNTDPQGDKLDGFKIISNSLYPNVGQMVAKNIARSSSRTDASVASVDVKAKIENSDVDTELVELTAIKRKKEEELHDFKSERKRMAAEHKARTAKLEEEEEKLRQLETLRRKEEKDVVELMRLKRNLQEEMKKEQIKQDGENKLKEEEERKRLVELEQVRKLEEDKKRRQDDVERLRRERRKKEDDKRAKDQEVKDNILREAAEAARQEEEQRRQDAAAAAAKRAEEERQEAEKEKKEEERKKREEMKIQQLKKEKQEQEQKLKEQREREEKMKADEELAERLKHEEAERAKAEKDQKMAAAEKARAEEARRIAEEKMKKVNEPKPQWKQVPSNNLPVGWEKRLDKSTNRYFYINHNVGTTQWEPPVNAQPASTAGTFTTKLKEEPAQSSRGLSRSFSSPDIMKQLVEEGDKPFHMPNIDRASKPLQRFEPPVSKPVQRQYVVKRRDLNPVYGSVGPALTGLRNLGNTCYMNSTIQCLNNCTPLVAYFLNDLYLNDINRESSEGMHGEMVDDYAIVLKALWKGQYRCITPRDLKNTVGKYNPMFAGYQQQDSQEFLTFLLDGLHEGLNEVKVRPKIREQENDHLPDNRAAELAWQDHKRLHKSIIVELFQGQLKSTLQCKHCGKKSVTFQAFMFLSLPLPPQSKCSLRECIQKFISPEMMTGSCKWKCPKCRVERDAVKKIDIWKLPPILLIGLNRFVSDGMWTQKSTSYVDFPVGDLDMREYVSDPKSTTKYNLYGISNHYGTMEGGHYTAYCRNPCTKKWYKYDDHEVYEMSSSNVKTSAAFVLYYTSIELTAPKYSPQL
ncbi:ubiquitin carboxyl-terminal hydrolase 8-like [Haliotis rufescens]|uniref:ubiquitin carboxyl-terminal hydrolase 8-like n=1 Tax=Haliotis rufescens TaxID=6454 RepID=UPI00201EB8EB|nr:ubiquitin carboxyl-terminal hydrolase 8-like [Haliotis rufescens]